MATAVKMGTKKAEELIYDFGHRHYKGRTLYQVYDHYSREKSDSWEKIESTCNKLKGWNLHITGASCHQYSCMYAFKNERGNIVLRKETRNSTYDLEMTPDEYSVWFDYDDGALVPDERSEGDIIAENLYVM